MTLETMDPEIILIVMEKHKWAEEGSGVLDRRNDLRAEMKKD